MKRVGQILVKSFSGNVLGEFFTRIIRGAFCKTSKIKFKRALKESETVILWATSYSSYSRALPEPRVFAGFGRDDGGEYARFLCPKDLNNRLDEVTYLHLRDIVVYASSVISFCDGEEIEGRFFCVEYSEFLGERGYILYQVIPKEEDKVSA